MFFSCICLAGPPFRAHPTPLRAFRSATTSNQQREEGSKERRVLLSYSSPAPPASEGSYLTPHSPLSHFPLLLHLLTPHSQSLHRPQSPQPFHTRKPLHSFFSPAFLPPRIRQHPSLSSPLWSPFNLTLHPPRRTHRLPLPRPGVCLPLTPPASIHTPQYSHSSPPFLSCAVIPSIPTASLLRTLGLRMMFYQTRTSSDPTVPA